MHQRLATWREGLAGEAPWMHDLATHLVRGDDAARELVQDAWLVALERPPRETDRPRAWLRTVMHNLVRQRARRAWVRGPRPVDAPEAPDPGPLPGHELERIELSALLAHELERLEEPYRATLHEHFVCGLSCAAIARRDRVPQGTVRWRLKEGLDRMRVRLDGRFGERRRWIGAFLPFLRARPGGWSAAAARLARHPWIGVALLVPIAVLAARHGPGGSARDRGETIAALRPATDAPGPLSIHELPSAATARASLPSLGPRAQPAASEPGSALFVRVLAAGGAPLAGAEIRVASPGGFEPRGVSDERGSALVPFSPADLGALGIPATGAHLSLRAFAHGHAVSDVLHVPRPGADGDPLTLRLGGEERILRGSVRDGRGEPLAGVEVFVLGDPNQRSTADGEEAFAEPFPLTTRTAGDGRYELGGLARREYVIGAKRPGRETMLLPLDAGKGEADLVLDEGSVVRGCILDEHGAPMDGARVWVEPLHRGTEWCTGLPGYRPDLRGFGQETSTGADGRYELGGLIARRRRLYAQAPDDPARVASEVVPVPARGSASWDATLRPVEGIRLRLLDQGGEPLEGWIVQLGAKPDPGLPWARWLRTDGQGRVNVFDHVGEAELVVYDPTGQGEPWITRQVRPGPDPLELVVRQDLFAQVVGRIADDQGAPLAGGTLAAVHENTRIPVPIALDASTGKFRARLEAGEYTLLLRASGGATWLADLDLAPGQRFRLGKLRLRPEGELAWRAERQGKGQENYRLEMCFGRCSWKVREGSLPVAASERVPPGLYRLDISGADGVLNSAWSRVEPGVAADLDLERLPGYVRVEVCGATEDAGPIGLSVSAPGEDVEAAPPGAVRCVALRARADGRYLHVLRLPPGEWRIQARCESGGEAEARLEVVTAGSADVVLDLERDP